MLSEELNKSNKITSPAIICSTSIPKPDKIKKYCTAYIIYSTQQRKKLKAEYPGYSNRHLTGMIAQQWNNLPTSVKEIYKKLQEEEKKSFLQLKQEGHKVYKYKKNPKFQKTVRFRTPYMFYIKSFKTKINDTRKKHENIQKIIDLSNKWKEMNCEERKKFIKMSEDDKKRYDVDLESCLTNNLSIKKKLIKTKEIINNLVMKLNTDNQPKQNKIKKKSKLIFSIDKNKNKMETTSQDELNTPVNKEEILNTGLFQHDNYSNLSEYKEYEMPQYKFIKNSELLEKNNNQDSYYQSFSNIYKNDRGFLKRKRDLKMANYKKDKN